MLILAPWPMLIAAIMLQKIAAESDLPDDPFEVEAWFGALEAS